MQKNNIEIEGQNIGRNEMGLSLREKEGKEIYPLMEIAKIVGIETTEMMRAISNEGTEKEIIRMYSIGAISKELFERVYIPRAHIKRGCLYIKY